MHPDRVGIGHADDLAGLGHVAGEARLGQPERLGLQALSHRGHADLTLQEIVLHHGEAEVIAFPDEHGPRFSAGESPGGAENPLEQGGEIALGGEGEADLEELLEERSPVGHRLGTH